MIRSEFLGFKDRFLAICILLIAMSSIQVGATIAKTLIAMIGAELTTVFRMSLATLLMVVFFRPWKNRINLRQFKAIFAYGFSLAAMNLSFYLALERHIPLGIAVAIEFIGPLGVALWASQRPMDFVWAGFAILGILLILPLKVEVSSLNPVGIGFALLAGVFWGLYIIFGKKAGHDLPPGLVATLGMLIGALWVLPIGIFYVESLVWSTKLALLIVAVGFVSSALPYSLEMIALKKLTTKNFGILMSLEPAFGAFSGLMFLNERLSTQQWFAIFCVMIASFGSSFFKKN